MRLSVKIYTRWGGQRSCAKIKTLISLLHISKTTHLYLIRKQNKLANVCSFYSSLHCCVRNINSLWQCVHEFLWTFFLFKASFWQRHLGGEGSTLLCVGHTVLHELLEQIDRPLYAMLLFLTMLLVGDVHNCSVLFCCTIATRLKNKSNVLRNCQRRVSVFLKWSEIK